MVGSHGLSGIQGLWQNMIDLVTVQGSHRYLRVCTRMCCVPACFVCVCVRMCVCVCVPTRTCMCVNVRVPVCMHG